MKAFLFSGQGSQYPGMGEDIYKKYDAAKRTFDEISDAVGKDMAKLCFSSDAETLSLTENSQIAIFTLEAAIYSVLKSLGQKSDFNIGFSLGEYGALYASEVLTLKDACYLIKNRAKLMQEAVPVGEGGMVAVVGCDTDKVNELVSAVGGSLWIANYNSQKQHVLSGRNAELGAVMEMAANEHIVATRLAVSVPCHCALLDSAARTFSQLAEGIEFADAKTPIIANIDGKVTISGSELKEKMILQLSHPIHYCDCILCAIENGVDEFAEIGPGVVLTKLTKRIDKSKNIYSLGTAEQLEQILSK